MPDLSKIKGLDMRHKWREVSRRSESDMCTERTGIDVSDIFLPNSYLVMYQCQVCRSQVSTMDRRSVDR